MTPKQKRIWRAVIERDNKTCQQCGRPGSEVHHIISRGWDKAWNEKNMLVLCWYCHQRAHGHEARKRHLRTLRDRYGYTYEHPKYLEALEEMLCAV